MWIIYFIFLFLILSKITFRFSPTLINTPSFVVPWGFHKFFVTPHLEGGDSWDIPFSTFYTHDPCFARIFWNNLLVKSHYRFSKCKYIFRILNIPLNIFWTHFLSLQFLSLFPSNLCYVVYQFLLITKLSFQFHAFHLDFSSVLSSFFVDFLIFCFTCFDFYSLFHSDILFSRLSSASVLLFW